MTFKPLIAPFFAALVCSTSLINISHAALPMQQAVPGGIAVIKLDTDSTDAPTATYQGKRVLTIKYDQAWHAVVGIPLSANTGKHTLDVAIGKNQQQYRFDVTGKEYESQYLTIENKRQVNPNDEDMKRINSEKSEIANALAHWNEHLLIEGLNFILPVEGRLSSPFGLRRYFNNQPRRPHSGLDIAAPIGTPIHAPADGVVIETGDYFFNGKSVFIDHGRGLVTMYGHMNDIDAVVGQRVKQGDKIGTVGKTGRSTGPHLHWGVSLNDSRIDPTLFVPELYNTN